MGDGPDPCERRLPGQGREKGADGKRTALARSAPHGRKGKDERGKIDDRRRVEQGQRQEAPVDPPEASRNGRRSDRLAGPWPDCEQAADSDAQEGADGDDPKRTLQWLEDEADGCPADDRDRA